MKQCWMSDLSSSVCKALFVFKILYRKDFKRKRPVHKKCLSGETLELQIIVQD